MNFFKKRLNYSEGGSRGLAVRPPASSPLCAQSALRGGRLNRYKKILYTLVFAAACALITACEQPTSDPQPPAPAAASLKDVTVGGVAQYPIAEKHLVLSFSGQELLMPLPPGHDLSRWITNIPVGLEARALELVPIDANVITIAISGTPLETRSAPVAITIPENYLSAFKALSVTVNEDAKFEIVNADAIVESVTVGGIVGRALDADIVISLIAKNNEFAIGQVTDISGWFDGLPEGLRATVKDAADSRRLAVNISGMPKAPSGGVIAVTIPGDYLTGGSELKAYLNELSRYTILPSDAKAAMMAPVTINGAVNFSEELGLARPDITFVWKRDEPVPEKEITINLHNETFAENAVAREDNLSSWITNLPAGLSASAKEAVSGGTALTLTVTGKPLAGRNQPVTLTIPGKYLVGRESIPVSQNAQSRFYIVNPNAELPRVGGDMTENKATVAGVKGGGAIKPVDLVITLSGDTLAAPLATGTDASSWFTEGNLPAGLSAAVQNTSESQGNTYITLRINGSPDANGEDGIARGLSLCIPSGVLNCGVPIKVLPEASARFVIAASAMTESKAREMIQIEAGSITETPEYEYGGGMPTNHGGTFPRQPGPFYITAGTVTIPGANQPWTNLAPIDIPRFRIGKYEVTRELWYEVYSWAIQAENGYSLGYSWAAPDAERRFFAQNGISCQEAVIWCNARSEKEGKTPVYYRDQEFTEIVKDKSSLSAYSSLCLKPGADGYRVPTPAMWEYAARGGDVNAPAWNWRWPGTTGNKGNLNKAAINALWLEKFSIRLSDEAATFSPETMEYMWIDTYRLYDVYNSEIQVGILKPNSAGIHDMAGNLHEWTVEIDSFDSSQTITRGGAFNRDSIRAGFDSTREQRKWSSSRDIIGLRVLCDVEDGP